MKPNRPLTLISLLLGAFLLGPGCHALWVDDIDPVYEVDDEEYVVVFPVNDPDFRSPWDSTLGHKIAQETTEILKNNAEFMVVPYSRVIELMLAPKVEDEGDDDSVRVHEPALEVRDLDPTKVAELVGADYVLITKLLEWQLADPKNINMMKATGVANVRLFKYAKTEGQVKKAIEETERVRRINKARKAAGLAPLGEQYEGGRFVSRDEVSASYPDDYLNQYGDIFLDRRVMEEGLINGLARKIAELYYSHEPEDMKGSGN